jgi:HEAT repeat protein
LESHTRDLERQLKRLTWSRHGFHEEEDYTPDPETQLRVDALNALNPDAGDMKSFETLREVALDQGNPVVLRQHAVHIIAGAESDAALPVFVALAKNDTNETMRLISLDYLAQAPGDKSVDALIEVFHTIPPQQAEISARVFYTIAEVGNDKAVDFLSTVARTHNDLTLRREAVFYLGAIGSERSRAALQTILRGRD